MSGIRFGAKFRQARQQKGLTQAAVAGVLGISQSAVAQWEAGRSFPAAGLAPAIKKLLEIDSQGAHGEQPVRTRGTVTTTRLPIIGLPVPGDDERLIIDDKPHGEVLAPPQLETVAGAKALYVRGRSMQPRYYPGEVVYLNPNRAPNPGDFVLVVLKEHPFKGHIGYIRQYLGEDLTHLRLATLSPWRELLVAREDLVAMATIVGSGLF